MSCIKKVDLVKYNRLFMCIIRIGKRGNESDTILREIQKTSIHIDFRRCAYDDLCI